MSAPRRILRIETDTTTVIVIRMSHARYSVRTWEPLSEITPRRCRQSSFMIAPRSTDTDPDDTELAKLAKWHALRIAGLLNRRKSG